MAETKWNEGSDWTRVQNLNERGWIFLVSSKIITKYSKAHLMLGLLFQNFQSPASTKDDIVFSLRKATWHPSTSPNFLVWEMFAIFYEYWLQTVANRLSCLSHVLACFEKHCFVMEMWYKDGFLGNVCPNARPRPSLLKFSPEVSFCVLCRIPFFGHQLRTKQCAFTCLFPNTFPVRYFL